MATSTLAPGVCGRRFVAATRLAIATATLVFVFRGFLDRAIGCGTPYRPYHKLRQAVAFANFGKLRFKTELEQQLWNECSRLITHGIIYYNATLVSALWEHYEKTGQTHAASLLKQISPVAWQHINFHGRYEFSHGPDDINIEEMVQRLARNQAVPETVPTSKAP